MHVLLCSTNTQQDQCSKLDNTPTVCSVLAHHIDNESTRKRIDALLCIHLKDFDFVFGRPQLVRCSDVSGHPSQLTSDVYSANYLRKLEKPRRVPLIFFWSCSCDQKSWKQHVSWEHVHGLIDHIIGLLVQSMAARLSSCYVSSKRWSIWDKFSR